MRNRAANDIENGGYEINCITYTSNASSELLLFINQMEGPYCEILSPRF